MTYVLYRSHIQVEMELGKHFIIDVDYKIETITPPIGGVIKERGGAHKKEKITLNIRTFKKYCLKSDTENSIILGHHKNCK